MKSIKYLLLAKSIRFFLYFGLIIAIISFAINFSINVFNTKSYLELEHGTLGQPFRGYNIPAQMSVGMADTINVYKDSFINIHSDMSNDTTLRKLIVKQGKFEEQITNEIISYQDTSSKISKNIHIDGNVIVKVLSKNRLKNFFWGSVELINIIWAMLICFLLIKLVNRYVTAQIFEVRTFKIVSVLGVVLIVSQVIQMIIGLVNMFILQHPQLRTVSTLKQHNNNIVTLSFQFTGTASYSVIGIGIFIILLSQVLKEAILVKKENELTI